MSKGEAESLPLFHACTCIYIHDGRRICDWPFFLWHLVALDSQGFPWFVASDAHLAQHVVGHCLPVYQS